MSQPWHPHPPVWEWPGISEELACRVKDYYEERCAIMVHHGGGGPVSSEHMAYALMIERLHDAGVFSTEHIAKQDVVRQLRIAGIIRRSWEWEKKLNPSGSPGSAPPPEFQ